MTLTDKALRIADNLVEEHEAMMVFYTEIEPDEERAHFAWKAWDETTKRRNTVLHRKLMQRSRELLADCAG